MSAVSKDCCPDVVVLTLLMSQRFYVACVVGGACLKRDYATDACCLRFISINLKYFASRFMFLN